MRTIAAFDGKMVERFTSAGMAARADASTFPSPWLSRSCTLAIRRGGLGYAVG